MWDESRGLNYGCQGSFRIQAHHSLKCFFVRNWPRIYFAERPLRESHLSVLEKTKDRAANIQMQAGWSNKSFVVDINAILANLRDKYVLERVQLCEKPLDEQGLKAATEDCEAFFNLCVSMASRRAWTMMVHRVCQPDSWMGLLDETLEFRRDCFATLKKDVEVITRAWNCLQAKDPTVDLQV